MINRIFYNWKTSLVGLGLIVASFVAVYMGKSTLTEVSGFLLAAFPFLYSKDK